MLKHIKKIEDCKILLIKDEKAYYCSKNILYINKLVCLTHVSAIKKDLGIQGIGSEAYSWRSGEAQIDLIIDRKDNVVNLCEIKFSLGKYKLTKKYAEEIQNKINSFISSGDSKNKAVFPTIITTYGLEKSIHSGIFINQITLDELFL